MLPENFVNNPEFMEKMRMFFYPNILSIPIPAELKKYTDKEKIPDLIIKGISPRNEKDLKYYHGDFLKFCIQTADNYPWLKMGAMLADVLAVSIFLENDVIVLVFSETKQIFNFEGYMHLNASRNSVSKCDQTELDSFFKRFENLFILNGLNQYFRA